MLMDLNLKAVDGGAGPDAAHYSASCSLSLFHTHTLSRSLKHTLSLSHTHILGAGLQVREVRAQRRLHPRHVRVV